MSAESLRIHSTDGGRVYGRAGCDGFTLIELVIVVAIVAILAAVAYPSYTRQVMSSRRSDAFAALAQDQAIMERCYSQNFTYNPAPLANGSAACPLPATSPQNYYTVAISNQTATTYTITATAAGVQANDKNCATISIDQAGDRQAFDASGSSTSGTCWNPT
jgi:type IV pilus assembly protein PilE